MLMTAGALIPRWKRHTVEVVTFLPSQASAISLGAKDAGTTSKQGTYLKLECNSGQTVPLVLETGLTFSQISGIESSILWDRSFDSRQHSRNRSNMLTGALQQDPLCCLECGSTRETR